jgi:hypothetical protein
VGTDAARPYEIDGSWFERKKLADTCERDGLTMTFHTEHRPIQDYVDALAPHTSLPNLRAVLA